ncbi:MAG: DUF2786 domain-containing protein [Verrucomicrobiota bacterium]
MENNESIIEKIRALLRLAKSDNVHEAALAMQRAHEIALKHQVEISALPPEDDIHALLGRNMDLPARLALEWKEALNTVHGFFNVHVTVIQRAGRCLIVGTVLDIELAEYVVTYLVRACRQCLSSWKADEAKARRKTSGPKVHAFIEGFFRGIRSKLHGQREEQKAAHAGLELALRDAAEARKTFAGESLGGGRVGTITMPQVRRDLRSWVQGFMKGKETDINPGLRGSSSTLALNG